MSERELELMEVVGADDDDLGSDDEFIPASSSSTSFTSKKRRVDHDLPIGRLKGSEKYIVNLLHEYRLVQKSPTWFGNRLIEVMRELKLNPRQLISQISSLCDKIEAKFPKRGSGSADASQRAKAAILELDKKIKEEKEQHEKKINDLLAALDAEKKKLYFQEARDTVKDYEAMISLLTSDTIKNAFNWSRLYFWYASFSCVAYVLHCFLA